MIPLKLRTEYSFRRAYGKLDQVLAAIRPAKAAAITDGGTWGHVAWSKACKAAGVKPLFGVELAVVERPSERSEQAMGSVVLLARTNAGLQELYELVSWANTKGNYYVPRIGTAQLDDVSDSIVMLLGPGCAVNKLRLKDWRFLQYSLEDPSWNKGYDKWPRVLVPDNYYPTPDDLAAYQILAADMVWARKNNDPSAKGRTRGSGLLHIADEYQLRGAIPEVTDASVLVTHTIADACVAEMPWAEPVRPARPGTLYQMCIDGAQQRGLVLDTTYRERLARELKLIIEKDFEDYFYVLADLVSFAKRHMLVGPARGSAAGSLVCYLLGITDVDPIRHDLMFERFIDLTRADLPDVDLDFQDTKRELVIDHLRATYGEERVGRIGTVMRYKAKSTLIDVAKGLGIPQWEIADLKDAVIERSTGDARAQFCIADALDTLDQGKRVKEKYPQIVIAAQLEGHARQTGKHAAGVIVCQHPIMRYASLDKSGASQVDKKDAEKLNLLKIDVLGLRTLTVIQDTLDQIGQSREWLVTYPLDDDEAFELFNAERFSGIFQYEGYALQSLTRQMKIKTFDDIVVITALARPGPLHCGAATEFISRHVGTEQSIPLHPTVKHLTDETHGVVIYQEQVMAIGRHMGQLSWEDVSELRKAMSKSLGEEFFNTYWVKFREGAKHQDIPEGEAKRVWDKMCTFGSWAFNKSHAVSYGLLSYWCAVLKAHHPLQYAAACLRNAKDQDQSILVLRDLVKEGFEFLPVDARLSAANWSVQEGRLVGGLTNIKGIGVKKAEDIVARREAGKSQTPSMAKKLIAPVTPYDDLFEAERLFGDIYANPRAHRVESGMVSTIQSIQGAGDYVFIGQLKDKNLRDLNEYGNVVKRGGRLVKRYNLFLNMTVEDDTGSIIIRVGRYDYPKWGKPIVENGHIGDWYLWKGTINQDGWRLVNVSKWRKLPIPGEAPVGPLDDNALRGTG